MTGFPENQYFFIKSRANGHVLDVYMGETTDDSNIIIWQQKPDNDNANQLWRSEDGFLVNKKSHLVMDIRGGDLKSDTYIVQYTRKMTMAHNQRFGYRDGFIYCLADPRLVLDIRGGGSKEGTKIILYKRKESDNMNQQWTVIPIGQPNQGGQVPYYPPPDYPQQGHFQQQPAYPHYPPAGFNTSDAQNSQYGEGPSYEEVYNEGRKSHLSHRLIAGAAAFQAVKAYRQHQERQGEEMSHGFIKQSVAALAAAEIVKLAEEHNWSRDQKDQATREAQQAAEQYASREFRF
ncbi:hypothetical protein G6F56_010254 [Rhizopus delemar]|nr:hypothetical protein G6F56_010254 [Rhizopus delemar]